MLPLTIHIIPHLYPQCKNSFELSSGGKPGRSWSSRTRIHDPSKMYSISAEFGSLSITHLLVLLRARELQVNSHHKDWLISGSFGSFAVSCWEDRAPGVGPPVRGSRPNIIYLKTEFGSFKKSRPLRLPSYNPGTESMSFLRKSWATAPENSLTPGPPWALGKLTRINTGAP